MNKLYNDMVTLLDEIKRTKSIPQSMADRNCDAHEKNEHRLMDIINRIDVSMAKGEYKKYSE